MSDGIAAISEPETTDKVTLFSLEHLFDHARALAAELKVVSSPSRTADMFGRLQAYTRQINSTYRALTEDGRVGKPISGDGEWLLDNFYIVEEQLQEIEEDLPPKYFAELPKLDDGEPRVYRLARDLILHMDGLLDEDAVVGFVQAFQEISPLEIGEVWAVPIMLRIGLMEYLGVLSHSIQRQRQRRDQVEQILKRWPGGNSLPAELQSGEHDDLFVPTLIAVDHSAADDAARLLPLERLLLERCPDLHERVREYHQRQAASQISVGNVITAMRLLSALDWVAFFERCSLVEQILRRDPMATYQRMEYESRDRYRHALEAIAKRTQKTEIEVAEAAIQFAESVQLKSPEDYRKRHVGYWLIDDGRAELERVANYQAPFRVQLTRAVLASGLTGYLGSIALLTVLMEVLIFFLVRPDPHWSLIPLGLLIFLGLSDLATGLVNYLVTWIVPPRVLAKIDLSKGIPSDCRTIVVVPSMLTSLADVKGLLDRLEQHYLASADPHLDFALLTDFADADAATTPEDREVISAAIRGIQSLNLKYGSAGHRPFFLFHRGRRWNPSENAWIGWERKRGKLMEFNKLLRGDKTTSYEVVEGDLDRLTHGGTAPPRFVVTCDTDTQLPYGAVRRLIGTLAHPLNVATFDGRHHQPVAGYSLLQPRISVALSEGNRSWYGRIMANSQGIDPYGTAASDVYQDLFGEGSFTGKGIYDLAAFERTLDGAFPENQILSHDLIEGCHVRTALVSDIELIDGFPMKYEADAKRQHRWVRGDWQIAPWLLPMVPTARGSKRNVLSWLSCWKIADNLRRSLVPPAIVSSMLLGWSLFPGEAWWWTLIGLLCLSAPLLVSVICAIQQMVHSQETWMAARAVGGRLRTSLCQTGIQIVSLLHRALVMLDAIGRTAWRLFVVRKKRLEWQTAAATDQLLNHGKSSAVARLWYISVLAAAAALMLPRAALPAALVWLLAWFFSPVILEWLSRPRTIRRFELDAHSRGWLRQVSRRNWNYFEDNLGPHNHWLPPDNVQEYPRLKVAERLSPTNEGLFLVSVLTARDFGYLGLHRLIEWWEKNLHSLDQLPKVGGHFFNWYDTTTLQPLRPRYLSTVDSGNLFASLIVVNQGIQESEETPVLPASLWDGLTDTLNVAEQTFERPLEHVVIGETGSTKTPMLEQVDALFAEIRQLLDHPPQQMQDWPRTIRQMRDLSQRIHDEHERLTPLSEEKGGLSASELHELRRVQGWLDSIVFDYAQLYRWAEWLDDEQLTAAQRRDLSSNAAAAAWQSVRDQLNSVKSLRDVRDIEASLASPLKELRNAWGDRPAPAASPSVWLAEFMGHLRACSRNARELLERLQQLQSGLQRLIDGMDFRPLYDARRRLFSIGYNLEDSRLDGSYYDLLCSEARLSSFVAIAKGDVPVRHWFRLGRQTTYVAGDTGLLSWGGTMFEYLMPLLFQPRIENSLLAVACETAVAQQQKYAHQRGVPWGVSESAFASLSPNSDYQYQSFGVPGLGLKRGLSKDNVVAPYATMLALEIDPAAALANLRRLATDGLLARWGFYEAVDYTASRIPVGKTSLPVKCFMAHHQGMSFLSLANLLNQESVRRRFRAHPLMKAAELLLQEGIPASAPIMMPHADEVADVRVQRAIEQPVVSRRIATYDTPTPRTHLLSNGSYAVMLTNSGGGYSRFRDTAISRWRSDVTRDHWGQWLYLSDPHSGGYWSASYQPTLKIPDEYEVIYSIDKAEFHRRDDDILSSLEVAISPEDPVEVRQLKLTNGGAKPRTLDVTSYVEVVLTSPAADLSHPAFQKLFIETEYVPQSRAILARRRPRSAEDSPVWAIHILCTGDSDVKLIEFETSRAKFLGRGRTARNPAAMDPEHILSQSTGPVLDPIMSLKCRLQVPAESCAHLAFITGYATTREEALRLADLYHDWRSAQRAYELAWAYNQMELRHWRTTAAQTHRFQRLASAVLYPSQEARGPQSSLLKNRLNQSHLWPFGISGDRPIVLVQVNDGRQLNFVKELLVAQEYWAYRQFHVDLVLLNCLPGSYLDELQEQLERLIRETPHRAEVHPGTAYVIRCSQLSDEQTQLLETVATVVIDAARGWSNPALQPASIGMSKQATVNLAARSATRPRAMPETNIVSRHAGHTSSKNNGRQLEFWNGLGGFTDDGREYRLSHQPGRAAPMPWCNVIANPTFGCLLTEYGGGYTWMLNSRENKLTTWSNDPVSDPISEQLYLMDSATGRVWPVFGRPASDAVELETHHGQGWTRWVWSVADLRATVTVSVGVEDPIKFVEVEVENRSGIARELTLAYFAEWVLGVSREATHLFVVTEIDHEFPALLARNGYHAEFPDQVAFLTAVGGHVSLTGDRHEFLGRNGDLAKPVGMSEDQSLSGTVGAGLDPCGVVQSRISLAPHRSSSVCFQLGCGENREHARTLIRRYSMPTAILQEMQLSRSRWEELLETVQIQTPNRAFDLLLNRWLLYQTLGCRIWGRSGFYQSSGAYGFRDQLQDSMAVVYAAPEIVREHLLRAAARQYLEGDVQHWWHIPTGRGTRTKFSDDLLWLLLATCHYVDVTLDEKIWEETVPFLESPVLGPEEQERYECPRVSTETGTLYEHCKRALRHAFRLGPHGLPLMGCGDWNDGMNKVGEEGRGESVWVGWFLMVIIDKFLPVLAQHQDHELADDYRQKRATLWKQLERHAWDGEWYRRAFFDDGTPLGSHLNDECQIDSLSQSWAVLAGADAERGRQALNAAIDRLVRPEDHLVALLTPPFDRSTPNPGYIMGYLKGVRENGGQYTHAVAWLIQALTELGDGSRAFAIFDLINPIQQTATSSDVARYQVEPYVMAADVYSQPPHVGRGGWTWYTGSAAWIYRTGLESILGMQWRGNQVSFRPCVPENWSHFEVKIRRGSAVWRLKVELHDEGLQPEKLSSHGCETETVELSDDGQEHEVRLHCRRRKISHLSAAHISTSADSRLETLTASGD